MDPKVDESVEIRPKSPDVNLESGVDVSVVGNTQSGTATYYGSCAMAMDAGGVTARTL